MKRRILAILLSLVVILTFATPALASENKLTQTEQDYLAAIDYNYGMEVIRVLTEDIGPRYAGTFRGRLAGEYIYKELADMGYSPQYQTGYLSSSPTATTGSTYNNGRLSLGGKDFIYYGPTYNANSVYKFLGKSFADGGDAKAVTGMEVLNWNDVATDLAVPAGANYAGKAVVVLNNSAPNVPTPREGNTTQGTAASAPNAARYYNAVLALQAAGAGAVIFETAEPAGAYYLTDGTTLIPAGNTSYSRIGNTTTGTAITIPVGLTLYSETHDTFTSMNAAELAAANLEVNMETNNTLRNVYATKYASTPTEKTVYITAHYDSQFSGPGANDNGSGVGSVLALAKAFKNYEFDYNLTFVLFDGEELGLFGAYQFNFALTDSQRENFVANYNLDMMAVDQANTDILFLNVPDVARLSPICNTLSTNQSLLQNEEALAILQEYEVFHNYIYAIEKLGIEKYSVGPANSSDHRAFFAEATRRSADGHTYPNMLNSCHFDWRNQYRGYPNTGVFEELYHKDGDNMANISKDRLKTCVDVAALGIAYSAGAKGIEGPDSAVQLTSDKYMLLGDEDFTLTPAFYTNTSTNTAVMNFTYDKAKFAYQGYTGSEGVTLVDAQETDNGVKITVMIQNYDATSLGDVKFHANEFDETEDNTIRMTVDYVTKNGDVKTINSGAASVTLTSVKLGEFDLITLSNLIDVFGITKYSPEWSEYRLYDFNNNGEIDVFDISYVAQRIK